MIILTIILQLQMQDYFLLSDKHLGILRLASQGSKPDVGHLQVHVQDWSLDFGGTATFGLICRRGRSRSQARKNPGWWIGSMLLGGIRSPGRYAWWCIPISRWVQVLFLRNAFGGTAHSRLSSTGRGLRDGTQPKSHTWPIAINNNSASQPTTEGAVLSVQRGKVHLEWGKLLGRGDDRGLKLDGEAASVRMLSSWRAKMRASRLPGLGRGLKLLMAKLSRKWQEAHSPSTLMHNSQHRTHRLEASSLVRRLPCWGLKSLRLRILTNSDSNQKLRRWTMP